MTKPHSNQSKPKPGSNSNTGNTPKPTPVKTDIGVEEKVPQGTYDSAGVPRTTKTPEPVKETPVTTGTAVTSAKVEPVVATEPPVTDLDKLIGDGDTKGITAFMQTHIKGFLKGEVTPAELKASLLRVSGEDNRSYIRHGAYGAWGNVAAKESSREVAAVNFITAIPSALVARAKYHIALSTNVRFDSKVTKVLGPVFTKSLGEVYRLLEQ